MAVTYKETGGETASTAVDNVADNWCNFCGYKTDNLADYLAHSCIEVLEAKGQKVTPTGQTVCS